MLMLFFKFLSMFSNLNNADSTEENAEKSNILLFTHCVSTSHLNFVFNVAEQIPFPKEIYDFRWPMVSSIYNHSSRPKFHKIVFESSLLHPVVETIDKYETTESLSTFIPKMTEKLLFPCSLQDPFPKELKNASLALIDPFSLGCSIAVARNFGAKIAFVSPLFEASMIQYLSGAPLPESYVMSNALYTTEMTFLQRGANILAQKIFTLFLYQLSLGKFWFRNIVKADIFGIPLPSLVIVNDHKFFEPPLPRTNALTEMGNYSPDFDRRIDKDIETFMNQYDAIVLLSFSTFQNDGTTSSQFYASFVKTFHHFPNVGFIWRQKEVLEKLPKNVMLVKWINQRAVLSHPKLKILINHGGLNGVLEGFNAGVPMIGIPSMGPSFGDHFPNTERVRHNAIGIFIYSFSDETLIPALQKILAKNSIYSKNAKKFREMLEFERNQKISTNVSHAVSKFQRISEADFQEFYIPKGTKFGGFREGFLDWILIIVLAIYCCF